MISIKKGMNQFRHVQRFCRLAQTFKVGLGLGVKHKGVRKSAHPLSAHISCTKSANLITMFLL